MPMLRYFYLHGWRSSPQSNKARFFQQQFADLGLALEMPDFNQPDFFSLTLSRQIHQLEQQFQQDPVILLGSSLGASTALWLAQRNHNVHALILFAPAIKVFTNIRRLLDEARFNAWQTQRQLAFYHNASQREESISFEFIEDLQRYAEASLNRAVPTCMIHGQHDEIIPITDVQAFAKARPWIKLHVVDSDHGLLDCHSQLWHLTQHMLNSRSYP